MRRIGRFLGRFLMCFLLLVGVLAAPVIWVETSCRGDVNSTQYTALVTDPGEHRVESRTFLTYPEWHIVHAYDDYAKVIQNGDPHDYQFMRGIRGFWSSLCALSEKSAAHGGFSTETKQMVYTIGVSFTLELGMKALYEETLGRVTTLIRGAKHSALDTVSADQAAAYAKFLQQVPWYQWDFKRDVSELAKNQKNDFRDTERRFALGVEYGVKSSYAKVIKSAVASIGQDKLTLRIILQNISAAELSGIDKITVISTRLEGIEIETPRYRELTHILDDLASRGATFVEIAGNDDIMLTAISGSNFDGALFSFARQGYGDNRHLIGLPVKDLADMLRSFDGETISLEHVHDY